MFVGYGGPDMQFRNMNAGRRATGGDRRKEGAPAASRHVAATRTNGTEQPRKEKIGQCPGTEQTPKYKKNQNAKWNMETKKNQDKTTEETRYVFEWKFSRSAQTRGARVGGGSFDLHLVTVLLPLALLLVHLVGRVNGAADLLGVVLVRLGQHAGLGLVHGIELSANVGGSLIEIRV